MVPCSDCLQQKEIGRICERKSQTPANPISEANTQINCNGKGNDRLVVNCDIFLVYPHEIIQYRFDDDCITSLQRFYASAAKLGIVKQVHPNLLYGAGTKVP